MDPIRALARPMLASMFVVGGVDSLRNPAPRVQAVEGAGLSEPDQLVKINSITHVVGGFALATGRFPRLAALALAGTLVPTTYVGHPFWAAPDAAAKKQQQIHFFKNLSLFGGLLLAAADTGGRESLPHKAGRVSRRATTAAKALPPHKS